MERGRRICRTLKELRKRIADANGIPYEIEDCPHEGPCPGTCPKCEAEVRYLETALDEKRSRGEEIIIKGLMTEEELTLFVRNQDGIDIVTDPPHLQGMPSLPPEHIIKNRLYQEIFRGVMECMHNAREYPEVGLFISETDCDVLCVREPGREGEALFDYRSYNWRELLHDGMPSEGKIYHLVEKLIPNDEPLEGLETACPDEPLQGDIVPPLEGHIQHYTKIKKVLTSITVAGTSHVKNIEELAEDIYEGVELSLRHDKANKHDRNAIALYLGDDRIGFVPKGKNEILANILDADIPLIAIVTEAEWRGDWFSIKADIAIPE